MCLLRKYVGSTHNEMQWALLSSILEFGHIGRLQHALEEGSHVEVFS